MGPVSSTPAAAMDADVSNSRRCKNWSLWSNSRSCVMRIPLVARLECGLTEFRLSTELITRDDAQEAPKRIRICIASKVLCHIDSTSALRLHRKSPGVPSEHFKE